MCGCCHVYASYLEDRGVNVTVVHVSQGELLEKMGAAPSGLYSCHVAEVEGYLVIGHVPLEAVERLVSEKPDVEGIALPGMPPGWEEPDEAPSQYTASTAEIQGYIWRSSPSWLLGSPCRRSLRGRRRAPSSPVLPV